MDVDRKDLRDAVLERQSQCLRQVQGMLMSDNVRRLIHTYLDPPIAKLVNYMDAAVHGWQYRGSSTWEAYPSVVDPEPV